LPWVWDSRSYRETSEEANNPGNNLYVTGLSVRVSEKDLQDHFEQEGKVRTRFLSLALGCLFLPNLNCMSDLSNTVACLAPWKCGKLCYPFSCLRPVYVCIYAGP
jgi:RNA recognition motif-containing protein